MFQSSLTGKANRVPFGAPRPTPLPSWRGRRLVCHAEPRQKLELELKQAVAAEDYSTAARLKRELEQLLKADPAYVLKQRLEEAVKKEDYTLAAALKQELLQLGEDRDAAPSTSGKAWRWGSLTTSSNTVSPPGIRVKVQSFYRPIESQPDVSQYFYAYRVMIINESNEVVQLKSRFWMIEDGAGSKHQVRGPGVVGDQPILLPGKSFEYTSGCPLKTTEGSMEGHYVFMTLDQEDGLWKNEFQVAIGKFLLLKNDTTQL